MCKLKLLKDFRFAVYFEDNLTILSECQHIPCPLPLPAARILKSSIHSLHTRRNFSKRVCQILAKPNPGTRNAVSALSCFDRLNIHRSGSSKLDL